MGTEGLQPVHRHGESHSAQPGGESLGGGQRAQVEVGADEGLLGDVLSIGPVGDYAVGQSVDMPLISAYELAVALLIAFQGSLNEIAILQIRH